MKKYCGFTNIENQINSIIKPLMAKKKDNFIIIANLTKAWEEIVGKKFYQFCAPRKIKFEHGKKSNGILYLQAYNPSIAFYLEANSNHIIEKIAAYYGYKIVAGIRIEQQLKNIEPAKKQENIAAINEENQKIINDATREIKDPELQSILKKLGSLVFNEK